MPCYKWLLQLAFKINNSVENISLFFHQGKSIGPYILHSARVTDLMSFSLELVTYDFGVLLEYPTTTGFRWGHLKKGPFNYTVRGGNGINLA